MIRVNKENTLPNGSTPAYSEYIPRIGETIPVVWGEKEGNAVVVKNTLILGGQLNLIYLDVDWSSFDTILDSE